MRAILTYHSVDSSGSVISVDQTTFSEHLARLTSLGTQVESFHKVVGNPEAGNSLAITFDDGFVNFRDRAWPLLKDHGFSALLFVVADHVGKTNAWPGCNDPRIPIFPLLDWDSLGRLVEEGVEIGSHTSTHRNLTELSQNEIEDELAGAAERIRNELGVEASVLAYPFGLMGEMIVETARRYYSAACTTELRTLKFYEDPLRVPRLDAYYLRNPRWLDAWGKPIFKGYFGVRAFARRIRSRTLDRAAQFKDLHR